MLRLAWTMNFADPETTPLADLKQGLEDRGFSGASDAPVAVDSLLPIPLETDQQYLIRRAATEVTNLPGEPVPALRRRRHARAGGRRGPAGERGAWGP